jgi:hypothetical protein
MIMQIDWTHVHYDVANVLKYLHLLVNIQISLWCDNILGHVKKYLVHVR